jgi:hypothetical protein
LVVFWWCFGGALAGSGAKVNGIRDHPPSAAASTAASTVSTSRAPGAGVQTDILDDEPEEPGYEVIPNRV